MAVSLFTVSCDDDVDISNNKDKDCLKGSGATIVEVRGLDDFNAIHAAIVGNVYVTQGSPQLLRIETHSNVMEELQTQVVGSELVIDFDRCVGDIEKLDVYVTIPEIKALALAGVGTLNSSNSITSDNLIATLSGVGDINLTGAIDQFECHLTGVGDLNAFELATNDSKIVISGVGDAKITTNDNLEAIISGVGNIRFRGNPTIQTTVSGAGGVINSN